MRKLIFLLLTISSIVTLKAQTLTIGASGFSQSASGSDNFFAKNGYGASASYTTWVNTKQAIAKAEKSKSCVFVGIPVQIGYNAYNNSFPANATDKNWSAAKKMSAVNVSTGINLWFDHSGTINYYVNGLVGANFFNQWDAVSKNNTGQTNYTLAGNSNTAISYSINAGISIKLKNHSNAINVGASYSGSTNSIKESLSNQPSVLIDKKLMLSNFGFNLGFTTSIFRSGDKCCKCRHGYFVPPRCPTDRFGSAK